MTLITTFILINKVLKEQINYPPPMKNIYQTFMRFCIILLSLGIVSPLFSQGGCDQPIPSPLYLTKARNPVYAIPVEPEATKLLIRRVKVALERTKHFYQADVLRNLDCLKIVYLSSTPNLKDDKGRIEKLENDTPTQIAKYDGVIYLMIIKPKFDRIYGHYGRDAAIAHEIGHALNDDLVENKILKLTGCSSGHNLSQEKVVDHIAGTIFQDISYYYRHPANKGRPKKQSKIILEKVAEAYRKILYNSEKLSEEDIRARVQSFKDGFKESQQ